MYSYTHVHKYTNTYTNLHKFPDNDKLPITLSTGRKNLHTYQVMAQHTSKEAKLTKTINQGKQRQPYKPKTHERADKRN